MDTWIRQARELLGRATVRDPRFDHIVREAPVGLTESRELDDALVFTLTLAKALLSYGLPVHRLEEAFVRLSAALGFEASFYITPTGCIVTLGRGVEERTRVIVVSPGNADLERLDALHALVGRVERREIRPADGTRRIEAITSSPPRYGAAVTAAAFSAASMTVAVLLSASSVGMLWAGVLGLVVAALHALSNHSSVVARMLPTMASAIAAWLSASAARVGVPIDPTIVTLAAVIILLPGFTITVAMIELATANLLSGVSRFAGALVTLFQLAFGAALGFKLATHIPGLTEVVPAGIATWPLPPWAPAASLGVAAVAFGIIFRARPRDFGWVLLSCTLAVAGTLGGGHLLGPEVGAFVGALLVGLAAHWFARARDRPVALLLVPGVIMMVPGALGFLSLSSLVEADTLTAVQTFFQMMMIAVALATGVVLATALLPVRHAT